MTNTPRQEQNRRFDGGREWGGERNLPLAQFSIQTPITIQDPVLFPDDTCLFIIVNAPPNALMSTDQCPPCFPLTIDVLSGQERQIILR